MYVAGAGTGMVYLVTIVRVQEEFQKNGALASGIISVGGGTGVILLSVIRGGVTARHGWRKSVLIELSFVALGTVAAFFLQQSSNGNNHTSMPIVKVHHKKEYGTSTDEGLEKLINTESSRRRSLYKDPLFYLSLVIAFVITNGILTPTYFLSNHIILDMGLSSDYVTLAMSVSGIAGIVSRLLSGAVGTIGFKSRYSFFFVVNLTSAIMTSLVYLYTSYTEIIIYSIVIGFLGGRQHFVFIFVLS